MKNNFKIYFDNIVFNFQKVGGISVYFTELIDRVVNSRLDYACVEQSKVLNNILRCHLSIPQDKIVKENILPVRLISYLSIKTKAKEYSLVHSSYYRICNNPLAANIITVYDFNYELGFVRCGIRKYLHCRQKKRAVEQADGVICISESTKRDLIAFYPNVDPSKVNVIHLAAADDFFKIGSEQPVCNIESHSNKVHNNKYILFVGARVFHKNFDICVDTVAKLPDYELLIVGSTLTDDEIALLDAKLPSRYQAFSNIDASELNVLYNNAFCFLYPTSYEGFGIPVLEAMQAGCPVVSTAFSSIPEVAGDAGLLVDNISSDEFVQNIKRLEDESFRNSVIDAGLEQAKKFSWEKTYQQTIDFYQKVFDKKFNEVRSSF